MTTEETDEPTTYTFTSNSRNAHDLITLLEEQGWSQHTRSIYSQIKAQIPQPRIKEPAWGTRVKVGRRGQVQEHDYYLRFQRSERDFETDPDGRDWINAFGTRAKWDDLINPEVVS